MSDAQRRDGVTALGQDNVIDEAAAAPQVTDWVPPAVEEAAPTDVNTAPVDSPPSFLPRRRERRAHQRLQVGEEEYRARISIPTSAAIPVIRPDQPRPSEPEMPTDAIPLSRQQAVIAAAEELLESERAAAAPAATVEPVPAAEPAQPQLPQPQPTRQDAQQQPQAATAPLVTAQIPALWEPVNQQSGVDAQQSQPASGTQQPLPGVQQPASRPRPRQGATSGIKTTAFARGNLFASEWLKLRNMVSAWVAPLIGALICILVSLIFAAAATWQDNIHPVQLSEIGASWVSSCSLIMALFLVVPVARLAALEFRGPGQSTFAFNPQRWRVMAVKTLLLLVYTAVVVFVATFLIVSIVAGSYGIGIFGLEFLRRLCLGVLGALYVELFTLGLVLLTQSSVWTITLVFGAELASPILLAMTASLPKLMKILIYNPADITSAIMRGKLGGISSFGVALNPYITALMILVWLLVFWIPGVLRLQRSDIN